MQWESLLIAGRKEEKHHVLLSKSIYADSEMELCTSICDQQLDRPPSPTHVAKLAIAWMPRKLKQKEQAQETAVNWLFMALERIATGAPGLQQS